MCMCLLMSRQTAPFDNKYILIFIYYWYYEKYRTFSISNDPWHLHTAHVQYIYIYIYILIWFGSGWCFPPSKLNNFWYGCNLVHWHTDVHWLMNWWLSLSRAAGGGVHNGFPMLKCEVTNAIRFRERVHILGKRQEIFWNVPWEGDI